jgi:hypothetical protein
MSSNSTECSIQNENLNHSFEVKLDVTSENINKDINVDQNNNKDAEFESSDDFLDDDVLDPDYKLPPKRKRRHVSTNADSFLKCNETLTSSEESTTDYSSDEYETPITRIQNLSRNSLAENKSDPCQTQDYQDDVLISNAVVDPNEIMSNSVRENVCGSSGVQETEINQETQMEQNEVSIDAEIDHEEEIEAEERREESDPVQVREQITESTKGQKRRNKLLRERGLAYKGHKRNEEGHHKLSEDRKERVLREKQCSKLCKKMKKPRFCHSISEVDRQRMFSRFWYQMSWEEKKIYVIGLVEKGEKQSATLPDGAVGRRKFSYKYYLRVGDERKEVCRDMFLSTLGLTDKIVYDWIINSEGRVPKSKHPRKMSAREIQSLDAREHAKTYLNELPKVPSHYCRANSKKQYLEPVFNSMADLHREYLRKLQGESKPCVNYNIFKKMFKDMNFCLYKPKKDMCDLCTGYKAGTVDEVEYTAHIAKKTEAQNSKAADKETGKTNSKVKVVTVDLQSLLLCPQLNASCLYYKTKLSCHNYTIYDLVTKDVVCYFWNETDGDLSSNVFTSCMIDYLESLDLTGVETVIIYSDGCGYQNRNVTLANALLKFATERHVTIEQKYLERGHTYMECDSTHSVIEHQIRNKQIYLPQQFVENIEAARQDNPYVVKYVDFTFFKDYSTLDKYASIRPGIGVGSATVADVRQLKYDPDGIIYYKTGYENCTYEPLPTPRRKGSTAANPEQLYHMALPLKKSKYTHLQQIKQVIPKDYHSFYDSLPNHNS